MYKLDETLTKLASPIKDRCISCASRCDAEGSREQHSRSVPARSTQPKYSLEKHIKNIQDKNHVMKKKKQEEYIGGCSLQKLSIECKRKRKEHSYEIPDPRLDPAPKENIFYT